MNLTPRAPVLRRLFAGFVVLVFVAFTHATTGEEPTSKIQFNVPAGEARPMLRQLASQAKREIFFAVDNVEGVTTNAVHGAYSLDEALRTMLLDTPLVCSVDNKTGAISVARDRDPEKNDARLALTENSSQPDRSARTDSDDADDVGGRRGRIRNGIVQMEEYDVTATRVTGIVNQGVIPREENQAVRYTVISRADIERTGVTSMPDLMRHVSYNQETGTTSQRNFALSAAGTGNFVGDGDLVNFRGMGNGQTLVMINGRRLYGSDGGGADISRIPLAAVERIEILPSSGSAIYGGSSVAGVINVILRTEYRGTEVSTYLGASTDKGAEEIRFDVFHGQSFNRGRTNYTLSLTYGQQEGITRGERNYDERVLANPNLQPPSAAFMNNIVPMMLSRRGNIRTTSPLGLGIPSDPTAVYAAIPAGSDGIGLTPGSFNNTAGEAAISISDRLARTPLRQPSTNYAAVFNLNHDFRGDTLGGYTELTWRRADEPVQYPTANTAIGLSATDPRNPFRNEVTPGFVGRSVIVYRDSADLGDDMQHAVRTTFRIVTGLKGKWVSSGGRTFNWAVDGSWDRNPVDNFRRSVLSGFYPAAQAGLYNILRDNTGVTLLPDAELRKYTLVSRLYGEPSISALNVRLNGDIIETWGGPIRFSFGAESRREQFQGGTEYNEIGEYLFLPGGTGPQLVSRTSTDTTRDVRAAYAEAVVPLVSEKNRLVWLRSLELSMGVRYEKYSDFRAATPPVAAVKLTPIPDIAFRAAYSEGFQPPTLGQLSTTQTTSSNLSPAGYVDALRPGQVNPTYTSISSGNPDLRPETSKTWDVGVIFTPRWAPWLTVNASYFRFDKQDLARNQSLTNAILYFPDLVVRAPASPADVAANRPGPVQTFHNKPVNVARQFTDGVDLTIKTRMLETRIGRFSSTATGTWTKRFFNQARSDLPAVNAMGVAPISSSFVLEKRGSASVTWDHRRWSASLSGHYTDDFESFTTLPSPLNPFGSGVDGAKIPSAFTMDFQFSYEIPARKDDSSGRSKWLSGTRWSVGALNFMDEEPALWSDILRGFYSPFVDPRERFVYVQIRKSL